MKIEVLLILLFIVHNINQLDEIGMSQSLHQRDFAFNLLQCSRGNHFVIL